MLSLRSKNKFVRRFCALVTCGIYALFVTNEKKYTLLQLLLNLPCFGLDSVKCPCKCEKAMCFLTSCDYCLNQSVIIIDHGYLFRHGAIALNKLTNVIIIAPKYYWSCDQNQVVLIMRWSQQRRLLTRDVNQRNSVLMNSYWFVYILHFVSAVTH